MLICGVLHARGAFAQGPVASYGFNEGVGTVLVDSSGHNNFGSLSGALWTTDGRYSGALKFDGANATVTVPDSASLHLSSAMSLEAWVYPTSASGGWSTILLKETAGGLVYMLESDPDNRPTCYISISNGGLQSVTGPQPLTINDWTHLAATYDGGQLRLFVNGVEVVSQEISGSIATSTGPLCFGGNSIWGEFFAGRIDEVRIYDHALSPSEIITDLETPVGADADDIDPPSAPLNLVATVAGAYQVDLSWQSATDNVGVVGYRVEQQALGDAGFVPIGATVDTTSAVAGLTPGSTYGFRVRAEDAAGNLGPYSNVAIATTSLSGGGQPPGFASANSLAQDGIGVMFDGATLPLTVSGTNTLLIAAWHSEFDGNYPDAWRVECNGVPGTPITDTNGYSGGDGNRRFRTYYWLNPAPGSNTILVTNDLSIEDNELAVSAVLLTNVAQLNPIGAISADVSTADRNGETEVLPTNAGDLVVHVIAYGLVTRGNLGAGETSRSVANDGKHAPEGDASLWIATKPGGDSSTAVSSSGWASRVINGVAIAVHGLNLPGPPWPLTVTADAESKLYGDSDPPLTYRVTSGNLYGTDSLSGNLSRVSGENAGTYAIQQGSLAINANYSLTFVGNTFSISRRELLARADDQSRIFGQFNPALTISYSGFVNGDSVATLINPPLASTVATVLSPPGSYPILLSGGSDDNYDLLLTDGTLTVIAPRPVLLSLLKNPVRLDGLGDPRVIYSIQASLDLVHWEKIGVSTSDQSGAFEFLDSANNLLARFYRSALP